MAQELAPSDWTHQTFEDNSSVLRGIIRGIDEQLGIGIIASSNYSGGAYLIFFLCDINNRINGWQHGLGEGDNVEFETSSMRQEDELYLQDSYLFSKYSYKLCKDQIAINLIHLENGTVILEELLFDHPRYEGVVVTEPQPSIQHHAFGSYYGDDEPHEGLIRLVAPYQQTQIPPINQRYNVPQTTQDSDVDGNESDEGDDTDHDKKPILLQPGTMLNFSGKDLLTTRIVLRKGDKVEFDVYRDKSNSDVPFGATNIVFLDPDNTQRQHGFIYRFLSRQQSQYGSSEQKFGLIKSTYHEELFWHQSEILDRDEIVQIGDEVEFLREVDEMHGRLKASRITFLPKNTIQLTELSRDILVGKVESSTSYNKSALIEYVNNITTSKQLIEVQTFANNNKTMNMSMNMNYILVKGDSVQFRTESKHENPTNKRAVHVVVTKEVDRSHVGKVSSFDHKQQPQQQQFGEIEYDDRGGKKHSIYFYLTEWFDSNIDIYVGLTVQFNILESGNKKRAVRIRPTQLPLTKQERLLKKKQKMQKREQQIRQNMISQHLVSSNNNKQNQNNKIIGSGQGGRKKPPVLSNKQLHQMQQMMMQQSQSNNNQNKHNKNNKNNQKHEDDINNDDIRNINSNKPLSKQRSRRMRKQLLRKNKHKGNPNPTNANKAKHVQKQAMHSGKDEEKKDDKKEMVGSGSGSGGSNPIPSFDTMIPLEGIVLSPMRSKHGRGTIRYKWKRGSGHKEEEKVVEYDYDQKANWQRSIFLTEGDRVRLFFRQINEDDASLAYVALLDPVYRQRLYGQCYYYHPTKNYYLRFRRERESRHFIELWSYHIVDKKVQSYNLENELIVFDLSERINYQNDNKIATRCRWVRLDDKQWYNGKIVSLPSKNHTKYGCIKYYDNQSQQEKKIRFSTSSLSKQYKNYQKIGDEVKFHIEHVITKSTYDIIPATAVNIDTTLVYRPKNKK